MTVVTEIKDLKQRSESKLKKVSTNQWLLYAGAATTAAGAASAGAFEKKTAVVGDGTGQKLIASAGLSALGVASLQALAAHEQPTARFLGVTGALHAGAGVLTGVETFQNKAIKPEVGGVVAAGQIALGGALIARAIWLRDNSVEGTAKKIEKNVKKAFK